MAAKVFISHSSKDQKVARAICRALENRGFTCWIASRDVHPGENFQEAIVRAIRAAKVMVLVFSENANNSDEIKKELVLANQGKVAVIPARVEDVVPNEALAYEFATRQWIDLFEDWEQSIALLSAHIARIAPDERESANPPSRGQEPLGLSGSAAPSIMRRAAVAFNTARRAVPAVDFSIGAACVAAAIAIIMVFLGYTRPAMVVFGGMLAAMVIVVVLAPLLSGRSPGMRKAGTVIVWAVALLFVASLALTATAVGFRWPAVWTAALGFEDGVTCARPTENLEALSCGSAEGSYVVVNIRLDDADGGLVVREGPGVETVQRGVVPPNGIGLAVESCDGDWCRVQCGKLNLKGSSRKRYLATRSDVLYAVAGANPNEPQGLAVRTGPHQTCRATGLLPYHSREVILHVCQSSPLDRSATWCRITYQGLSGWIVYGYLDRQK
jgi:hypothetical protein